MTCQSVYVVEDKGRGEIELVENILNVTISAQTLGFPADFSVEKLP